MLARCCSRCCWFRMHISRKHRSRRGRMPIRRSFAFIPNGRGRSASSSTPACLRSLLLGLQTMRPASRPRQRPSMSLSRRGSGRHLRRCNHPVPSSHNRPIRKSENRGCNTRPRLPRDTRRRNSSWQRGNRNSVGLATASGEEVNRARLQSVDRLADASSRFRNLQDMCSIKSPGRDRGSISLRSMTSVAGDERGAPVIVDPQGDHVDVLADPIERAGQQGIHDREGVV